MDRIIQLAKEKKRQYLISAVIHTSNAIIDTGRARHRDHSKAGSQPSPVIHLPLLNVVGQVVGIVHLRLTHGCRRSIRTPKSVENMEGIASRLRTA